MPDAENVMHSYSRFAFKAGTRLGNEVNHEVYYRGSGPPVVLIQELPGIGPETLELASRLVASGYTVYLPHLFGALGKTSVAGNLVRVLCMRKEFSLFAANKSSPIVDWLRALCRKVRDDMEVDGVGVIGMCLTGNFAISLMGDDSVLAAVTSQPAMPLHKQGALHMTDDEITATKRRIDQTAPMMALRFEGDKMSTAGKFQCIHEHFNTDGKERVRLKTLPGDGHSVLTLDFIDEDGHPTRQALQEVIEYFDAQLKT